MILQIKANYKLDQLIDLSPVKRLNEIADIEVCGKQITVLLKNGELLEYEVELEDDPTQATYTVKRNYTVAKPEEDEEEKEDDDDIKIPQYLDNDGFD